MSNHDNDDILYIFLTDLHNEFRAGVVGQHIVFSSVVEGGNEPRGWHPKQVDGRSDSFVTMLLSFSHDAWNALQVLELFTFFYVYNSTLFLSIYMYIFH